VGGKDPEGDAAFGLDEALVGATATIEETVTEPMTAHAIGSGDVRVLGTPMLLTLAERAAMAALSDRLPEGITTVGTSVKLVHLEPTPVGAHVRVTASVERIRGRRLHFVFTAWDPTEEVAGGQHVRVLVDRGEFEAAAAARLSHP
jgi:predicted thioesterase